MKNLIKTTAFKNLMAHTCATAMTLSPSILGFAAFFATHQLTDSANAQMLSGLLSLVLGGGGQLVVALEKSVNNSGIFNGLYWKKKIANFEIELKKNHNEKKLLAARHLIAPAIEYQFREADYQTVAFIQISEQLNELGLAQWREGIKSFADLSEREIKLQTMKMQDLYQYINETAAKMDKARLEEIRHHLIERQAKAAALYRESTFSYFLIPSKKIDFKHALGVNQAVYDRARFFQNNNIQTGFMDKDYQMFGQIFAKGYDSVKGEIITSLIEFLTEFKESVNWTRLNQSFRDHFSGNTQFLTKTMATLQQLERYHQSDYEQSAVTQRIQNKIKNKNFKENHFTDSFENDALLDKTKNQKIDTITPSFTPCDYVYYEAKIFPDKWSMLRQNYALIRTHSDKIDAKNLSDLHTTLNTCLPFLISVEQQFSQATHKKTEQTEKLISDNLDLAIAQIEEVVDTLYLDVNKGLKTIKNYQSMKMNSK